MTLRALGNRLQKTEAELGHHHTPKEEARAAEREAFIDSLPLNVKGALLFAFRQARAAGREGDCLPELPESLRTLYLAAAQQGRWPEGQVWEFCTSAEWEETQGWLKRRHRGLDTRGVEVSLSGRSMSVLNLVYALEHGPDGSASYEAFLVARQMREQHADLPEDEKLPAVSPPVPNAHGTLKGGSPPPPPAPVPPIPVKVQLATSTRRGYRYSARDDLLDGVVPEKRWRWPR
jgi:hypothetical protein